MRLAWFTPWPPQKSGVAGRSAEIVPALCKRGMGIDVFVDAAHVPVARHGADPPALGAWRLQSAHDFIWRAERQQYDLTVYQVGNSRLHEFIWPYLFQWPGLAILHDARLHHARGRARLLRRRAEAYREEFTWNHPGLSPDAAELAVAGLDGAYYYLWPMTRAILAASRLVATHARGAQSDLDAEAASMAGTAASSNSLDRSVNTRGQSGGTGVAGAGLGIVWSAARPASLVPGVARRAGGPADVTISPVPAVDYIALGEGRLEPVSATERDAERASLGLGESDVVFGLFGALTPDKRLEPVLRSFEAIHGRVPSTRLLLAGASSRHDVTGFLRDRGLVSAVRIVDAPDDDRFDRLIAAVDVTINLRWPTARETSGPWLRALAAARPSITTALAHLTHVPALDPRSWTAWPGNGEDSPITVAVDILDEEHSLRLAMDRLATAPPLRDALGRAARDYWRREHSLDRMVSDYVRVIDRASSVAATSRPLPRVLRPDPLDWTTRLLGPFGRVTCGLR